MYPNVPNTRPPTQQVVDLKLARDLRAYAKSWLRLRFHGHRSCFGNAGTTIAGNHREAYRIVAPGGVGV